MGSKASSYGARGVSPESGLASTPVPAHPGIGTSDGGDPFSICSTILGMDAGISTDDLSQQMRADIQAVVLDLDGTLLDRRRRLGLAGTGLWD